MNDFGIDAAYNLERAASVLSDRMDEQTTEDAIMQFAFGIERFCKSILFDVNPIFLLENDKFDSAVHQLCRHRLVGKHKQAAESKGDGTSVRHILLKECLIRGQLFSETIDANHGLFAKIGDARNTIAHRMRSELDHADLARLLNRVFLPTIRKIASELSIEVSEIVGDRGEELAKHNEKAIAEEQFVQKLEDRLKLHRELWEKRKDDKHFVEGAKNRTKAAVQYERPGGYYTLPMSCPACDQDAVVSIEAEYDVEGSTGEGFQTGISVTGLECQFCDLELNDYEEFDYVDLNERLDFLN